MPFPSFSPQKIQPVASWLRSARVAVASLLTTVLLSIGATFFSSATGAAEGTPGPAPAVAAFGKSSLGFLPNAGQLDPRVRYYSRGLGYGVYFTRDETVFAFSQQTTPSEQASRGTVLALRYLGANPDAMIEGRREGTAKINFLTGNDPAKWLSGLSAYQEIVYRNLWQGVDLVFRQANGQLKYEFVLQPGAPVDAIRLAYRGAEGLSLDGEGNLLIKTARGVLTDERPTSYQVIGGKQVPVESRFALEPEASDSSAYGFLIGAGYDPRYPLVIDPGLVYSTLLGGTAAESGNAVAVDPAGNAYVAGATTSSDFLLAGTPYDTSFGGVWDAFVAKLDPTGALVYATFIGGSGDDKATGIALSCTSAASPLCRVYVTGSTKSDNFPTLNAVQSSRRGLSDAFVTVLKSTLDGLVYSTYMGGSQDDFGTAIAVQTPITPIATDGASSAYITGWTFSSNFPTSKNKFQSNSRGGFDAYVTKLSATGGLDYSTYLGGSGDDFATAIAVDGSGNAYVAGQTNSSNFPVSTTSASTGSVAPYDASYNLNSDVFVVKLNSAGSALLYSTYLGGSGFDAAYGIAIDATGKAYITGRTDSADFPFTLGANGGNGDAFVAKLDPSVGGGLSRIWITALGGSALDAGYAIAVDSSSRAYVTGETSSPNLATPDAFATLLNGSVDAFIARLNADGSSVQHFTYLGGAADERGLGLALDALSGSVYVTGVTNSNNFPGVSGSLDARDADAFVVRLDLRVAQTITVTTHAPASALVGASFGVAATASSGLPVAITTTTPGVCSGSGSGSATITMTSGTGTCIVHYHAPSNAVYAPADVDEFTNAQKLSQTITFGALTGKTVGDADFTVSATATSGLAVSFTAAGPCTVAGNTVHITGAGTCTITASQAGNANYASAPNVPQSFLINTKPEVTALTFSSLAPQTNATLTALATPFDADGNPVTLSYVWKVNGTVIPGQTTPTLNLATQGYGDPGDTITVEVTPSDGISTGGTASASVVVGATVVEGNLLTFHLNVPAASADNLPTGATFNASNQTLNWTPNYAQGGPNPYFVHFKGSDGQLKIVTIFVNDDTSVLDSDGDGIPDSVDNCPFVPNPTQVNVCQTAPEVVNAAATISPAASSTSPINVTATFTFNTGNRPDIFILPPNSFNVICRVYNGTTLLPFQNIPENAPIVLSSGPDGHLIPLAPGANVFSATFDLRTWYPNLPAGSYSVVCTYVNFADIPGRVAGDGNPTIWVGEANAPPVTVFFGGPYTSGFGSPADHEPFNQGRTVPIKFQLMDSSGAFITNLAPTLWVQQLGVGDVPVGNPIPATPSGGGTGNIIQYSTSGNQYQFNMKTDTLSLGNWQLQVKLGGQTFMVITIIIR